MAAMFASGLTVTARAGKHKKDPRRGCCSPGVRFLRGPDESWSDSLAVSIIAQQPQYMQEEFYYPPEIFSSYGSRRSGGDFLFRPLALSRGGGS